MKRLRRYQPREGLLVLMCHSRRWDIWSGNFWVGCIHLHKKVFKVYGKVVRRRETEGRLHERYFNTKKKFFYETERFTHIGCARNMERALDVFEDRWNEEAPDRLEMTIMGEFVWD